MPPEETKPNPKSEGHPGAAWLDGEIAKAQEEIKQLVAWERDDLGTKLERMENDGTLLYEQLGNELHSIALDIDRRIAGVVSLQRGRELLVALGTFPPD